MGEQIKFTFLETPFKGCDWSETQKNLLYVRACARDCLNRGENPYASHMFFTQRGVLDDRNPEERMKGILAGQNLMRVLTLASQKIEGIYVCSGIYIDRGISEGMNFGIENAKKIGRDIVYRKLGEDWEEKYREFLNSKDWLDLGMF